MFLTDEYLYRLQEASPPTAWRKKIEVYILKGDQIVVGHLKKDNVYMPAGGGVEKGQSLESAAKMECLEEIAVRIANPVLISKETFKVDWYKIVAAGGPLGDKSRKRMRKYRGQEIHSMKADFVEIDKRYWGGEDGERMTPVAMRRNKLINTLRSNNPHASQLNAYRIRMIKLI